MVREKRRWRGVGGEQLYIQGVGIINGDHGLAIVVQIFEENFTQSVDLACIRWRRVPREKVVLLFESA